MEPTPTDPAPSPIPVPGAIICAREECRARIPSSGGSGMPFQSGPWKGGYWCEDCWTLWYDENPWHLADQATKDYIAHQARRIRDSRETAEVLYEEPLVRLTLTSRGTVRIVFLEKTPGMAADECDPLRLQALARGLESLSFELPAWFPEKESAPAP